MSKFSRSLSEIESTTLRDVLPIFLEDFQKDFCVDDVKDILHTIFPGGELCAIMSEVDEEIQILRLFWILGDSSPDKTDRFLETIQLWYPWLSQKVREVDILSKDVQKYIRAVRELQSDFQKFLDFNVHRMKYYCLIRWALKRLKPYNYVVLSGELGAGKKWLVIDVCSEYSINKSMGFNIFWLDVRNCNSKEEDLRALQQFQSLISKGDSKPAWRPLSEFDGIDNKILHLKQNIRDQLQQDEYKDCLLVLSDVQNSKTWKTFNLGCKVLIITRNRRIADSLSKTTTKHVPIDSGLTTSECFQLFEKMLQTKRNKFSNCITDIFIQSNGQPYLLSLIANNLNLNNQSNWTDWLKKLQNLQITDNKFTTVVEISLKFLRADEMELYKKLTIFPHSIDIPLNLLVILWNKEKNEADRILSKFYKYSIIIRKSLPDGSVVCVLPYIYSSYLKIDREIDRPKLHRQIVQSYGIIESLEKRKEVNLFLSSNDKYFYHCIGYHLLESGESDLFAKLFLDFGFLEDKLRSDGFPNTIGDLKFYRKEIADNDPYKKELISEILNFLPTIEEMLYRSTDTCLLQYGLMADGLVRAEAEKQAQNFPYRIWFTDEGQFHQRRHIVRLPNKPVLIKLLEPDTCIIVLDNNNILLADISLDYNNGPVYFNGNPYPLVEIKLILQNNYILTLDVKGYLKVWSITDDRRRSANRKRSSRTKVNPLNLTQSPDMLKRKYKQIIKKSGIQTFHIESFADGTIDLHLANLNGDICVYTWNAQKEEFEIKRVPILLTKVPNIVYLSKILHKYYLVLSKSWKMYFYNLRDGSHTPHSFIWPQPNHIVYVGEYKRKTSTNIVFVCRDEVLHLKFEQQKFELLMGDLETVYNNKNDEDNEFTCACLSPDGCYLVIGTKHGLVVFNTEQKSEMLRGNVSECISCVDIYPLDDNFFKYIIVCGTKHSKVLNLFALRQLENNTIAWSHRLSHMAGGKSNGASNDPQFEPDVWLQGKKLFDLSYSDSVLLVAADSKNRIHQLCTTDTKNWSISMPPETSSKISAITAYNHISLCAYENGTIFDISNEVFVPSFTDKSITFLQMINENTFVASSKFSRQSIVRRIDDGTITVEKRFDIEVFKCFRLFKSNLILVDPEGGFSIVAINDKFDLLGVVKDSPDSSALLGGCDLKNNYLLLATTNFKIRVHKFSIRNNKLDIENFADFVNDDFKETDEVTCVSSSSNAALFAIGLKSGAIEIYQIECDLIKFIFRLQSHTSMIYDLKFSPNSEILVSCSEQFCFWHVEYILNNPFDMGTKQKRRSSRFRSSHSPVDEVSDSFNQLIRLDSDEMNMNQNPWLKKQGPAEKPELLSCIKFAGNKAEIFFANKDFTQFNTIDNEGVYYHLCLHDISRTLNVNATNGNSHFNNPNENDGAII